MIPVSPLDSANEPEYFDRNCRQPGNKWLRANVAKDPHKYPLWSEFKRHLAEHFSHRCGWLGTTIQLSGHVDHMKPCSGEDRHLAYEWSNYRYIDGVVNSRKGAHQVLDPCLVGKGWFRVELDTFQLLATEEIPEDLRDLAEFTLKKLDLRRGHDARWTRWNWYCTHWNDGELNLAQLRKDAPLVAEAVEAALAAGEILSDPTQCMPQPPMLRPRRRDNPRKSKGPSR